MSVNALVTVSDGSLQLLVDLEPVIDATCDEALIKNFSGGGFNNKDILRAFLPDLGNPQPLRDLLDWADFGHHEIRLALVEADWLRYLKEHRPGIIEKAKTNIAAAVTINDFDHAAALSKLIAWRYLTFAQVGFCMATSLILGMVVADNAATRAFFAILELLVLMVGVSAIGMFGTHNSATAYYRMKTKLKDSQRSRARHDWVDGNDNQQEE